MLPVAIEFVGYCEKLFAEEVIFDVLIDALRDFLDLRTHVLVKHCFS